jgi:hypothetical protein
MSNSTIQLQVLNNEHCTQRELLYLHAQIEPLISGISLMVFRQSRQTSV